MITIRGFLLGGTTYIVMCLIVVAALIGLNVGEQRITFGTASISDAVRDRAHNVSFWITMVGFATIVLTAHADALLTSEANAPKPIHLTVPWTALLAFLAAIELIFAAILPVAIQAGWRGWRSRLH